MEELKYIAITDITPNPYQPRLTFDQIKLEELAQSIKENGLIQPLIVRKSSVIGYELLAGERRWRAAQIAQLTTVPAIIKDLSDDEMMQQSIIENLQRSDLNPIEEALSYKKLLEKGLTHERIATIMGKSRPYITNSIRLLQLANSTKKAIENQLLSQGHARLLIPYSEEEQEYWTKTIQEKELSVRSLEKMLQEKRPKKEKQKNLFLQTEEKTLSQLFGTSVSIKESKNGDGTITIRFSNFKEEERIINNLKKLGE
ncbi:ParB/RepB/Spo0J family partition protein [Streptococcus cameli]